MRETTNKFVAPSKEIILSGKLISSYACDSKDYSDHQTVTFSLDSVPLEPWVFDMYQHGGDDGQVLSWKGPVPFEMDRHGFSKWETGKKTWDQQGSGSAFNFRARYSNYDGMMNAGADQIGGISCFDDGTEKELDVVPPAAVVEVNRGAAKSFTEKMILAGFPEYIPMRLWDPATITFAGSEPLQLDAHTTNTLTWKLYIGRGLDPEVEIIPPESYPDWRPEAGEDEKAAGNTLDVRVTLKKGDKRGKDAGRRARFIFELTGVSKMKGVCINWPPEQKATNDPDLRFDPDYNPLLTVDKDGLHARSDPGQYESQVVITSCDWGAYGKLKVTAWLDDDERSTVSATVRGHPDKEQLAIPKDDKDLHIADSWQEENNVVGCPASWDEVALPGQASIGDSLCLYDKYRGTMVMENGSRVHKRLAARSKHLFVIDPDNVFAPGIWESASTIRAYKLSDDLVRGGGDRYQSRVINFNGLAPNKYAVRFEGVPSDYAMEDLTDRMPKTVPSIFGLTLFEPGSPKSSPRFAIMCMVYVKRIRDDFCRINDLFVTTLETDSDACGFLESRGISGQAQCEVWKAMRDASNNMESMEGIIQKVIHAVAVHEAGHACGLPGHIVSNPSPDDPGRTDETNTGDLHCPMRYLKAGEEDYRLVVLNYFLGQSVPLLEAGRFCGDGYNCFGQLNVNDSK